MFTLFKRLGFNLIRAWGNFGGDGHILPQVTTPTFTYLSKCRLYCTKEQTLLYVSHSSYPWGLWGLGRWFLGLEHMPYMQKVLSAIPGTSRCSSGGPGALLEWPWSPSAPQDLSSLESPGWASNHQPGWLSHARRAPIALLGIAWKALVHLLPPKNPSILNQYRIFQTIQKSFAKC